MENVTERGGEVCWWRMSMGFLFFLRFAN